MVGITVPLMLYALIQLVQAMVGSHVNAIQDTLAPIVQVDTVHVRIYAVHV